MLTSSHHRPSYTGWIADDLTPADVYMHHIVRTIADVRTPIQHVRIIDGGPYGKKLFLDGVLQSASGDEFIYHEALVHPAMLAFAALRNPREVLILGGGEGASLREILRWRYVERVVMVDIDQEAVELCRRHLGDMHQNSFDDPRAELVFADAADYLRQTREKWDVIVADITEPVESGPSNFCFTREFFASARDALSPWGVLVTQSGPVTPPLIRLHARVTRTLACEFAHVQSYAAGVPSYAQPWGFTLAAQAPLMPRLSSIDIDAQLQRLTSGGLRFLDGEFLPALLKLPRYAREAIALEQDAYTALSLPAVVTS